MKHKELIAQMTLEEKCYLLSGRDFWQTRSIERLGVESMTLADGPHGVRKQEGASDQLGLNGSVPATCYPTAATIANSWNEALGEAIGTHLGVEAAAQDVCVLLGPGANMKRSPLCGRNFEYFSEDPYLAGKIAASYVRGIQSKGVAACPKHFAVNSQEERRMASDSVLDERTLRELYLTAYEIAVKEGHSKSLMSSYNRVNGVYANENEHLLQEILRDEWGFDGFVVSDWGGSNDHVEGVRSGSHLEMPSTGGDSDNELVQAVKDGKLSPELLDRRVDEILDVILSTRAAVNQQKGKPFDKDAHHAMAEQAAAESIVLLKNDDSLLPLKSGCQVAVIGDFAKTPRYQGAGSSVVNCTKLDNTLDNISAFPLELTGYAKGFCRTGDKGDNGALKAEAVALAKQAEIALLYVGLDEIAESEGLDRPGMKLPKVQDELVDAVLDANPNTVIVLSGGSAIEMPWADKAKAIIHGYLGGQAGAVAMLKALVGQVNPSGKLSESYPFRYEDTPAAPYFPAKQRNAEYREGLYIGYRYYETAGVPVRYPFGYGLSYTSFAYSDLAVSEDKTQVTFTVTNTGSVDGAEVSQLYVSAKCSGVYRPSKELKGFAKTFLKAGEGKTVTILLDDKAFRYFNVKTNRFEIEGGDYEVQIGASVADIRLSETVAVEGTNAPMPYDMSKLPSYASGQIGNVSDSEFAMLLGHSIPNGDWTPGLLDKNDAICQMYYAKSWIARFAYKIMTNKLNKSMATGKPDLNILFIYNMPFRGIGKMTGGMVSQHMVDGMLLAVNGHFFRGVGQLIGGYFKQHKVAKNAEKMQ